MHIENKGEETSIMDSFKIGFEQGRKSSRYMSAREVLEKYPTMTTQEVELFLNGMDDGFQNDKTRLNHPRKQTYRRPL